MLAPNLGQDFWDR